MYSIYTQTQDLENYILELIPTLPQLNCLEESFYSFYVCTAVRKFFFFLDPMRTGRFPPLEYGRVCTQEYLTCTVALQVTEHEYIQCMLTLFSLLLAAYIL